MALQLVGRKAYTSEGLPTPYTGISLTTLTGGLDTQPSEGDLIVIGYALGDVSNAAMAIKDADGTNYPLIGSELFADDTRDLNIRVAAKFAGATPDTTFQVNDGFGGDSGACNIFVQVWRGADPTTPLDAAVVTASGVNTGRPNPGSITPVTTGATILCFAAGTAPTGSTPAALTSSGWTYFEATPRSGTAYASISGAYGHFDWTSGAFNPAEFGGGSASTSDAWAAISVALRPAPPPAQTLTAPLLASAGALFAPTVTRGAVSLAPPLLASSGVMFAPTVTTGAVSLAPPLLTSGTLFAPTVTRGAVTIAPPLLASSGVMFAPSLAHAGLVLLPPLLTSGTLFAPSLLPGAVTLTAPLLAGPGALFAANEAGFWGAPSPATTWQDIARTIPGAIGQVVKSWQLNTASGVIYATQPTTGQAPLLQHDGASYYLDFDGTDDFLATPSINFTDFDEMTVIARLRKDSDATFAVAIELSATTATNAGSFNMLAPSTSAVDRFSFRSRGTINTASVAQHDGFAAPVTAVLTGLGKISTDVMKLRVNGTELVSVTEDQGTGNFGNYPIYIGRRGGASSPFNGRVYNLIVRGALTSGGLLEAAEAWSTAGASEPTCQLFPPAVTPGPVTLTAPLLASTGAAFAPSLFRFVPEVTPPARRFAVDLSRSADRRFDVTLSRSSDRRFNVELT